MRQSPAPPNSLGTFLAAQFSAGYTTNMSGFDLRQAQAVSITLNEIYDTLDVRPRPRLQVVKNERTCTRF
jgi:hypothetical protein